MVLLERPEHLRAGEIPMNAVLANSIAQLDGDIFLQTHSTNPFLSADTIDAAVSTFHSRRLIRCSAPPRSTRVTGGTQTAR